MTHDERNGLAHFLRSFIETHPGTRCGQLFGRCAAFVGVRMFAEITDSGLACRLQARLVPVNMYSQLKLRSVRRFEWVVVLPDQWNQEKNLTSLVSLLELAVAHVATTQMSRLPG